MEYLSTDLLNNKKALLLLDSNCLVIHGKIDRQKIKRLSLFIKKLPFDQLIINDRFGYLKQILEENYFLRQELKNNIKITYKEFKIIDFSQFKDIYCPTIQREEIDNIIREKHGEFQLSHLNLYNFNPFYIPLDPPTQNDLSRFIYQESFFPEVMESIIHNNYLLNMDQTINDILIIDDHYRDFYIGDTCLWLSTIRQIQQKTDGARITVAIGNRKIFEKMKEIFTETPFPNMNLIQSDCKEINFSIYDTLIIHQDTILKTLKQIKKEDPNDIRKIRFYRFSPYVNFHEIKYPYLWDINHYFKDHLPKAKISCNLNKIRRQTHKEIIISDNEILEANEWLNKNGYLPGKRLFILINEASSAEKVLPFDKNVSLIKLILKDERNQILIFDYKGQNKKKQLKCFLTKEDYKKIIEAKQLGLRKEMGLMTSPYVFCVIGPCTGLMHLANGITTFIQNKNCQEKNHTPFLLVYTGSGYSRNNYHPNHWWRNSKVKCITQTRQEDINIIKELKEVPKDIMQFHKATVSVNQLSVDKIFDFINKNIVLNEITA